MVELCVVRHGVVASTNEVAFGALAAGEARHGDVHVATAQTAGRGRFGRTWESAEGEGVYASAVLLPDRAPPPAALTIAGGLATLDAVRDLGLATARLSWPNDVLVDRAKLAGILVETRGLDPENPHYVLGIGLNVRQTEFPAALASERAVTSLLLEGVDVEVRTAEERLLARLARRLEEVEVGPQGLAAEFLEAAGLAGCPVSVATGDGEIVGVIDDLSVVAGLSLRTPDGERRLIAIELVRGVEARH